MYIDLANLEVLPLSSLLGFNKSFEKTLNLTYIIFHYLIFYKYTNYISTRFIRYWEWFNSSPYRYRFTDTLFELVFKKVFFLFRDEILHSILCFFINLFIYIKPSFLYFLKRLTQIISFSEISLWKHSWKFLWLFLFLTGITFSMASISIWIKFE